MSVLIVLGTLIGVATAQSCDSVTWSLPTVSEGNCRHYTTYPSTEKWWCDWNENSGFYYNYFHCHPYERTVSYLASIPRGMWDMVIHTVAIINQCTGYAAGLDASSVNTYPYMCPNVAPLGWTDSRDPLNLPHPLVDSTCVNVQGTFCGFLGVGQQSSSVSTTETTTMTVSQVSSVDMLAHFMAYYDYNSYRMNYPNQQNHNELTDSYLDRFVSGLYDCQKAVWNNLIKLDCGVVTSMLGVLAYPQQRDWPYAQVHASAYQRYLETDPGEVCKTIVDHVYRSFANKIHVAVEYVTSSWSETTCSKKQATTHVPIIPGVTRRPLPHNTPPITTYPPWFPKPTTRHPRPGPHVPFHTHDDHDDGLSEWVIIVLSGLGIIGFLGFSALLFFLIYRMYTYRKKVASSNAGARYSASSRENGAVVMNMPRESNGAKSPPTPPPSYENADLKKY